MGDDKGKKLAKRPRSAHLGGEDVDGIVLRKPPRKKSPEKREGTTGILRVDCSKPRRSSGSSVDFRGVPDRLTAQGEPPSPQPSVDRLSVTFAEKSDCSDSSVKVNIFDPGSPPSQIQEMDKVRFCSEPTDGEDEDEDDYSASVSVIMQRRESMKRVSSKRRKRRPSSPLPDTDGLLDNRRRSSEYTNSSGDFPFSTATSAENETTQEQIFENIRLHKEVLSNVKLQPWGMRRKIRLVQQAKAYVKRHEGELQERLAMSKSTKDILARFNIWLIKKLQFLKRELANMMTLLIPWELRIKEIESHFGSAVASYFTFLRWMFWVNLVITIVLACFVAIPEMLTADVKTAGERKVLLPEEKLTATNLVTLWDFEGVLKYSPIFYGYYTNRDGPGTGYRLPFAYFMTGLAVYVYSFVATLRRGILLKHPATPEREKDDVCGTQHFPRSQGSALECTDTMPMRKKRATSTLFPLEILKSSGSYSSLNPDSSKKNIMRRTLRPTSSPIKRRMAENSRMSKLSEKDDECVFTWKIFTGWDYMIGNAETAHNRVASLILGFKEALLEETERKKDEKNWKVICLRVLVFFVIVGLLAFSAYIVFVVVERSTQPEAKNSWWRQNEITVSVSIISLLFPWFFEFLGLLEGYHPRKSLRIQLARIMVLNLLNLYTLIFSQFWKISDMAIELQSLKKNYSHFILSPKVSSISAAITPVCVLIAVNCSKTMTYFEASSAPATTLWSVANFTTNEYTLPPNGFENISTTSFLEVNSTNLGELADENSNISVFKGLSSVATTPGFFPVNGSLADSEVEDASTESTNSKDSSSTIPYLITILADILKKSMKSSKMNSSQSGNYGNSTELFFGGETTPGNNSEETLEFDFGSASSSTEKSLEDLAPDICYVKKCEGDGHGENPVQDDLGLVYDMETRKRLRSLCWETMFGQELVKLTVMDLLLTILSVLLLDFFRAIFVRVMNNCWCWDLEKKFPQYGDFKIAENILHLVYNQGMVWMGMFFSPGLPAINLIKLVIMMYLRSWAVLTCNVPHQVVFRASRSNNFYLALLLTMLFLCVLPVGFAIVWIEPSWHCGPFSDYERIYHLFTQTLQRALPKTLHKAFDYIASPGIIIPLLMLLVLIIYYLVSLTNSLREANNDLKVQLRRERTEERRKMFQLVNKRVRKGSKDSETPFAKWKKLLPELTAKQITLGNDVEKGEKNENDVSADLKKEINRKEILARLMKKALRKSSGTSDEDLQLPDEPSEGDQQDSLFEERESKSKPFREKVKDQKPSEISGIKTKKPRLESAPKPCKKGSEKENRISSPQRSSLTENIPVIKISKIESDECLLKDDEPKRGKARFKVVVRKFIAMRREQKESLKGGDSSQEERMKVGEEKNRLGEEKERRCPIAEEELVPAELDLPSDSPEEEKY